MTYTEHMITYNVRILLKSDTDHSLVHLSDMLGITRVDKNARRTTRTHVSLSFDMPATVSPICYLSNINPLKPNLSQLSDYTERTGKKRV